MKLECSNCGKPRDDKYKTCSYCRCRNKRSNQTWREGKQARGLCTMCGRNPLISDSLWCELCRDRGTSRAHNIMGDLRKTVFEGYGAFCNCCGETTFEFLSLDHVNGGGNKERAEAGCNSQTVYRRAIKENFPPDLQILCYNCNLSKGFFGYCPHQLFPHRFPHLHNWAE